MTSEKIKKYSRLLVKKYRQEAKQFLVEGIRLCREALLSDWQVVRAFVTPQFQESPEWEEFREYFKQKNIPFNLIGKKDLKKLSDTDSPQPIVLVVRQPEENAIRINLRKAQFLIILDGVRDPGNMGTIIRSADWFGAEGIIVSDDCVDVFNPKVIRSTMGSLFHLPVLEVENIVETLKELRKQKFRIWGTSLTTKNILHRAKFKKPLAIILGGEAFGISTRLQKMAHENVRIWKFGEAESLNVAVAGGIVMYQVANQIFLKSKRSR